jgi:hypothetical protein
MLTATRAWEGLICLGNVMMDETWESTVPIGKKELAGCLPSAQLSRGEIQFSSIAQRLRSLDDPSSRYDLGDERARQYGSILNRSENVEFNMSKHS